MRLDVHLHGDDLRLAHIEHLLAHILALLTAHPEGLAELVKAVAAQTQTAETLQRAMVQQAPAPPPEGGNSPPPEQPTQGA